MNLPLQTHHVRANHTRFMAQAQMKNALMDLTNAANNLNNYCIRTAQIQHAKSTGLCDFDHESYGRFIRGENAGKIKDADIGRIACDTQEFRRLERLREIIAQLQELVPQRETAKE